MRDVVSAAGRLIAVAVLLAAGPAGAASDPFESEAVLTPDTPIDRLVLERLKALGIQPAQVCSDAVFVRRAYLDVIGTLPTEAEARGFILDRSPDKRRVLIDQLLEREEFAVYWAMKWCDLLRVKAEFPINLWPQAAEGYYRWIRASLRDKKPYDRFVREMLTASGSNFRTPAVNFYRAIQDRRPPGIAQAVALTFMGTRTDAWPKERLAGLAAFFSQVAYKSTAQWKEEIVYCDPTRSDAAQAAVFPDGTSARLEPGRDPRETFADWLIDPKNPYFARNIANRIWAWLLGRGIIHEPDDIRPDNPASNPELLAYLESELVAARWDLKHLYRLILNSKTYQLSPIPRTDRPEGAVHFAHYPLRPLEAEVLIDALCQLTGTTEEYQSAIPEPFTFIPADHRTMALPDGSITSSFLEMFGRPPRDTGLWSERSSRPTAAQRLHLLNSSHIQNKIERGPGLRPLLWARGNLGQVANRLYLTILSRFPTDEEVKTVTVHAARAANPREAAVDLAWALINSVEFRYRH